MLRSYLLANRQISSLKQDEDVLFPDLNKRVHLFLLYTKPKTSETSFCTELTG